SSSRTHSLICRVLVVDDFEPWRRHVRSAFDQHARFLIVGEAIDGLDAIREARALRPDLILLDVSMPSMNGLEAARHILGSDPGARILFVSEHRMHDVVSAALDAGACGFVIKSDAARDLLMAMETAADGGHFVSPRLGLPAAPARARTRGSNGTW